MVDGSAQKKCVAIVGAGIVGVATALWLQRDGHDVILVDKSGPAEGTSFGNGGVLAASGVVPVTVPGLLKKAPKMLFSPHQPLFLKWPYVLRLIPWLARYLSHANAADVRRIAKALTGVLGDSLGEHQALAAGTPAARYVQPSDYLFLYRNARAFEADGFGWAVRRENGYGWRELAEPALRREHPSYGPAVTHGIAAPDHGWIRDPGAYVKTLAKHVEAGGGRIVIAAAEDVVRENGRVTGLRVSKAGASNGAETLACDAVVIAAGAWSVPLCAKLGLKIPLESERGYHIELWDPSITPKAPAMFTEGKFVVTPMEGRIRVAGIVEFGGLKAAASTAPIALLKRGIKTLLPDVTWGETTEWLGHRPAPTDSIPLIGAVPGVEGAYLGFGHQHVGLTGGPKTGRLLAQLISGRTPNLDLAPYAPSRFQ